MKLKQLIEAIYEYDDDEIAMLKTCIRMIEKERDNDKKEEVQKEEVKKHPLKLRLADATSTGRTQKATNQYANLDLDE